MLRWYLVELAGESPFRPTTTGDVSEDGKRSPVIDADVPDVITRQIQHHTVARHEAGGAG